MGYGANNQQNARAINLSSGQYWLTVLDSKGCREVVSIFLPLSTATKEELDLQKSISIFPTPNRGSFTIYFEDNVRSYDISKIEVYSSIGVKVLSDLKFNFPSCEYTLDLPNGIYYLHFVNTRNMRIFKSLIINR
ncbi:MAG: T9SS type A sorting domain-containing protein [Saprospiraceae bacterium]|nr:T9SS type A sorting domain-containing protein [Saprospiraceae bacterium]